jgi:hypothetical protein
MQRHRLSRADLALFALLLTVALLFSARQILSPDIGFHLRAGQWILEQGAFPGTDPFTVMGEGLEYVDTYWLYQVAVAGAHAIGGSVGIVTLHAALVAVAFALLAFRMMPTSPRTFLIGPQLLLALGLWAVGINLEVRPHMASWVYLGLLLLALETFLRNRKPKPLVAVPVIMLCWANTHPLFVLGWVALGAIAAGLLWHERKLPRAFLIAAGASLVVCLANPYGLTGVLLPFQQWQFLQGGSMFKEMITEYRSPLTLEGYVVNGRFVLFQPLLGLHLLLVVAALGLVQGFRRLAPHEVLLMAAFLFLGLSAKKNVGYLVFALLPLFSSALFGGIAPDSAAQRGGGTRAETAVRVLLALMLLVFASTIVSSRYYINSRGDDRFGHQYNRLVLPVGAADALLRHRLEGRIVHHFNFGGHFIQRLPQKAFIDGRNELFGEKLFREYLTLWNAEDKSVLLAKYSPDIVVIPTMNEAAWIGYLKRSGQWRAVHVDEAAAVYLRAGYADTLRAVTDAALMEGMSRTPEAAIDAILTKEYPLASFVSLSPAYFPQKEISLSTYCFMDDRLDAAIQIGLNAVMRATVPCPEAYYNLGNFFFEKRDFRRALYCYERFLATNSDPLALERYRLLQSGNPG